MRENISIPAMRESDMRAYLEATGLSDSIVRGETACAFCGRVVTWNDIGGILVKEGRPVVICAATECIEMAKKGDANG